MLTLPGVQPLSISRAIQRIPASQLEAFYRETDEARKWVLDWVSILDPLRYAKGRVALFTEVARTTGDKPGNVKRRYYAWLDGVNGKCDPIWENLIDRARFPKPGDHALDERFLEHWRGLRERAKRLNDGGRQAHRDLLAQLAQWEARPHDADAAIPGYLMPPARESYCGDARQRVPAGWSYRNLSRYKPTRFELLNVIVGPKAASAHLPSNLATRAGLAYRSILFSDDQDYDNRVASPYTRGENLRPQGFNVLDYLTGHFETYGIQFRRRDEDGKQRGINQEFYVWTVLADFVQNGFRDDDTGTRLIREHATAKGYVKLDGYGDSFDEIIYHITGGRVSMDASGRFDQPMFAQMFFGGRGKQSAGNFRYKAPLESAFHAVRTRSAGLLGDTGNRYQIEPESSDAVSAYERRLFKAIDKLPPSDRGAVYEMLRHPVHTQHEFSTLMHLVYRAVNARRDHDLEGWHACGFVVPAIEFTLPGQTETGIVTRDQFALMPTDQQGVLETFGKWRGLHLSPAEARALCLARDKSIRKLSWSVAVAALPISWAYPKRRGKEGGVKVTEKQTLVIRDPERFGPESLTYLAVVHREGQRIALRPGDQVFVHVCPFAPDEAIVMDLQGRYQGTVKLMARPCANDVEARLRNQGAINELAADLRRGSERRAEGELQRQRDLIEHNKRVLSGDLRPDPDALADARFRHEMNRVDEAAEDGVVIVEPTTPWDDEIPAHHTPAPTTPGADIFANIFANNPELDTPSEDTL